jgi:hypothetical protein
MSFVTFSTVSVSIPVKGKGIYTGWKMTSIMHSGRKINLSNSNYYYIPFINSFVSYRGTKAVILKTTDERFNFTEKLMPRGTWAFKVDCYFLLQEARNIFG